MVRRWLDRAGLNPAALLVTLVLCGASGWTARALHLPLGLLMGSLCMAAVLAITGTRVLGQKVHLPVWLRTSFVPVIGVYTGSSFTPEVAAQMFSWVPSLIALCVFIPVVHVIGFLIYRRGGLPPAEAFFGAAPGGLIETVTLGRQAGADEAMVTVLQFLRLIVTIVAVPVIFWALTGQAVGSAAGARMAGAALPLTAWDTGVLVFAGVFGFFAATRLRLPAAQMTGPLILSAAAHALGLVHGTPPLWLVGVTQVVLGTGLGVRFAGADHRILRRGVGLALVNTTVALALAGGFAAALHALVGEPLTGVFLAYAPGGLAEMSLIAISLQASVAFVTVHHVARIVLAVTVAKIGARMLAKG